MVAFYGWSNKKIARRFLTLKCCFFDTWKKKKDCSKTSDPNGNFEIVHH